MIITHYSNVEYALIGAARMNIRKILSGVDSKNACIRHEFISNPRYWWQLEIFWSWFKYLRHGECRDEEQGLREVLEMVTKNHYPHKDTDKVTDEVRSVLSIALYKERNQLSATPEEFTRFIKYIYSLYVALG